MVTWHGVEAVAGRSQEPEYNPLERCQRTGKRRPGPWRDKKRRPGAMVRLPIGARARERSSRWTFPWSIAMTRRRRSRRFMLSSLLLQTTSLCAARRSVHIMARLPEKLSPAIFYLRCGWSNLFLTRPFCKGGHHGASRLLALRPTRPSSELHERHRLGRLLPLRWMWPGLVLRRTSEETHGQNRHRA